MICVLRYVALQIIEFYYYIFKKMNNSSDFLFLHSVRRLSQSFKDLGFSFLVPLLLSRFNFPRNRLKGSS